MIISHSKKFVFVKTRKTAGTAIEIYLSQFLDPEQDVATPIWHPPTDPNHQLYVEMPAEDQHVECNSAGYSQHSPVSILPQNIIDDYFIFTVERNPWQKCISYFHMFEVLGQSVSEREFFMRRRNEVPVDWTLYTINNKVIADFILQYDTLQQDFEIVCDKIGIPAVDISTIQSKHQVRKDKTTLATDVFSDASNEMIHTMFSNEIKYFNYTMR